jgi:GDP-L-fucose synthase
MKILITGTNGFVGRNLKEYLQEKYDGLHCPKRGELDLLDTKRVHQYLVKNAFDVVLHCAVTLLSVEQNLKMYFNMERCSRTFGKMLCVGSGAEYDKEHCVPKIKEECFGEHMPSDIYGFSKYVIAQDIENRRRNIYNLRVFGIYGKYEDYRRRFISNNICRVLCGLGLFINKNMYFDYLYVNDFAKIVDMFLLKTPSRQSYNICTGQSMDLLTIAEIIRKIDGRDRSIIIKEKGLGLEYSGDNTRFLREFGDFDFIDPEHAINEMYHWYKDQGSRVFDAKDFQ